MGSHDISVPWRRFLVAYRAGVDATAVEELRSYIRAWDEAFWASDFSSYGAVYTDDVVLTNRSRLSMLLPGPHAGIDGFDRLRGDIADVARYFRFDVDELRRGSADRLIALGQLRIRSRYAGLILRTGLAAVWTLRDDKICRAEAFTSRRLALREAGLAAGSIDALEWDDGQVVRDADEHDDLGPQ